jgi:hypothetical protein
MSKETIIKYQGNAITLFSDERDDYINLTEMAIAAGNRKSILTWIRTRQTIEFFDVWERKYNKSYSGAQLSAILELIRKRGLTIKMWIEMTNAKGIFTRGAGDKAGTYAHKDLAMKFAGYISPEFELFMIEEVQKVKKLEEQKNSFELLTHDQILYLTRLKEVFKYVAHQEIIEDAHKDVYAARSSAKNPFLEFNMWRNKILDIGTNVIDDRIKKYCIENQIALNPVLRKTRREKILILDSYESVKNAVWDFLSIQGEVNALNLATLVGNMIKVEKGEVLRENETDLFHTKQDLAEFNDFENKVGNMSVVKTAREVLEARKKSLENSPFNMALKGILSVPKPDKD